MRYVPVWIKITAANPCIKNLVNQCKEKRSSNKPTNVTIKQLKVSGSGKD